jgi:hypothetical protein
MADDFYNEIHRFQIYQDKETLLPKNERWNKEKYDMNKKEEIKALLKSMALHQFHPATST